MRDVDRDDLALIRMHAEAAGGIALRWFGADPEVWTKDGDSPVSEADIAVNDYLQSELMAARPHYGWLSEETLDDPTARDRARTFVVDPIDGTRGFINGMRQWCISIAVVENNRPVAGVLVAPVLKRTVCATRDGGAFDGERRLRVQMEPGPLRVTGPRVFMTRADDILDREVVREPFVPSLAWRIAMVATGEVDVAFARASANDWDLAAADLIASEAGACLSDIEGGVLTYNCPSTRHGALVSCRPNLHDSMLDIANRVIKDL